MNLVKPGSSIDFVGQRKLASAFSLLMVMVSVALFVVIGPNWGIDFTGGTEVVLKFDQEAKIGEVREALTKLELSNDAVQQIGAETDYEYVIRIQDPEFGVAELRAELDAALEASFGADWVAEANYNTDGVIPKLKVQYIGSPVTVDAVQASIAGVRGAKAKPALDDNTIYVELDSRPASRTCSNLRSEDVSLRSARSTVWGPRWVVSFGSRASSLWSLRLH
jgi:preprotein translocase subunit SecF